MAAPVEQCGTLSGNPHRFDGADNDRVGMPLDDLFDAAIHRRERVGKDRRAGDQRNPVALSKTLGAGEAAAGEAPGKLLVAFGENIDRECAFAPRRSECRRCKIETDNQRRGNQRKRSDRRRGAARARFSRAGGDDADAGGEFPHCEAKIVARVVPELIASG